MVHLPGSSLYLPTQEEANEGVHGGNFRTAWLVGPTWMHANHGES